MTRRIDALLQDAAPITDDEMRVLSLDGAEAELRAAIVAQRAPRYHTRRPERAAPRRVRTWSAIGLASAAGLGVVVALTGVANLGTSADRAWAATALRVANAVPRIAIGADGWKVQRADEFTVGWGEMTFGDGTRTLDLSWQAHPADSPFDKLSGEMDRLPEVDVLGSRATVFRDRAEPDFFTALWRQDGYLLQVRTGTASGARLTQAEFTRVLGSLRIVSVDDWLSAMPASVVLPDDHAAAVKEMLADIPVPKGFDVAALTSESRLRDRYQLGARVSGAVACAWIGQWVQARKAGDQQAATAAVTAMASSRHWAILREMEADGDYPKVLSEYADAIAGDGTIMGGKKETVAASYKDGLGCDS
jgi:hypothetical protein